MEPVTVSTSISRPREEVFEYLADIANHAEFTDHFRKDFRLTREQSVGRGAGARFRASAPLTRFPWADVVLAEVEPPFRIAEVGHWGKYNRVPIHGEYRLDPAGAGSTRVSLTFETDPPLITDRLIESLGTRRWVKRQNAKALRRLRNILEEDLDRGRRATLAGG
ncbi:MAG TPA: SRPBCC family protein [Solirubrobacteraceae bacterium]|nr:SRPBCC family protein [Solirubrobacteraceae bacterium]